MTDMAPPNRPEGHDAARHQLYVDVAAAAWGYRVAYETYWGEDVPGSALPVERKQGMLDALVHWQTELDAALAALDDNPGDFAAAKAANRETVARAIKEATDAAS